MDLNDETKEATSRSERGVFRQREQREQKFQEVSVALFKEGKKD